MSRTMSEKQKRALAEGRRRKAAERRAGAKERVEAFQRWAKRDAEITVARAAGNMIPREPMPPISDEDYLAVRNEARETANA